MHGGESKQSEPTLFSEIMRHLSRGKGKITHGSLAPFEAMLWDDNFRLEAGCTRRASRRPSPRVVQRARTKVWPVAHQWLLSPNLGEECAHLRNCTSCIRLGHSNCHAR